MNMKKRSKNGFLTALVAGAILLTAVLFYKAAPAQSPSITGAKSPKVASGTSEESAPAPKGPYKVSTGQILRELLLTGELRAERSIVINVPNIRSSFSNTISFLAPEGKLVKRGERIVEFDDSSLMNSKSEAERTLDEAKLNIQKKKADLEAERCDLLNAVAQAEADLKVAELYGRISKDLLPGNTYQQYQLDLNKAQLALQKAKEKLANFERSYPSQIQLVEINRSQAEINLKKIESDMALLKIDAPQDGILIYGDNWASNRKVQVGDSLFQGMEVASLPDLASMQVIGYVYDTEYGSILRDARCEVTLDALPGFKVDGRVVSLSSVASRKGFASEKKLFQAVVRLDRVDTQVMKPGMTARVKIPIVLAKDAVAVPREYLGTDSRGRYFVLKGTDPKTAGVQNVELGAVGDRLVQIASGLSVGDPLLPLQRLPEVKR